MHSEKRIRVLVARPGLDGHDQGARVVASALRDAGMEVIYTGLFQTPEQIVKAALEESVDVIGLSILSGAHDVVVPRVMELLAENEVKDEVLVVVGGIIPAKDTLHLEEVGVSAVFPQNSRLPEVIEFVKDLARKTRVKEEPSCQET